MFPIITVGIDLDNTFWNLGETALDILNNKYGHNIDFKTLYSYDVSMGHPDFRKEDMRQIYLEAALTCEPYRDAVRVVNRIRSIQDIRVYFVTSSTPQELKVKIPRLRKFIDYFRDDDIIVLHQKELLNVDYMIDDLYRNLCNPHLAHGFLYYQPYNFDSIPITNRRVDMVLNWNQIEEELIPLLT